MFEKASSVQLSQRDSRTLDAARKRVPKRVGVAKAELIYRIRTYTCSERLGVYVYMRTEQSMCSCVV